MGDRGEKAGGGAVALVVAAGLVLHAFVTVAVLRFVGLNGWDDGAITLAYSKTFAETGKLALTAASDPVEGFSSLGWFLLNTGIAQFYPGFEGMIASAQVLTGLSLAVATVFMALLGRRLGVGAMTLLALVATFALSGAAISETANGMEMGLASASALALAYWLYGRRNLWLAALATVLFLTARFEACLYFAAMLTPLLLRRDWRTFATMASFGLVVFGVEEAWRLASFHDLLPNTLYAKTHAPYAVRGFEAVHVRVSGGVELIKVLSPLVAGLVVLAALAWPRRQVAVGALKASGETMAILAAPIVAVELFSILTGKNWGYEGRMQFVAIPFAVLLFGLLFETLSAGRSRLIRGAALAVLAVATIGVGWATSAKPLRAEMALARRPGGASAEVTPAAYRTTGLAIEHLRTLLGRERISFVTPDVGGLGLCCREIRVIDLGLLTNRRLAHEGHGALAAILAAERPEAIEGHQSWAALPRLYDIIQFRGGYQPAIVQRTRLFLRDDAAADLLAKGQASWCAVTEPACRDAALKTHRYAGAEFPEDDAAFLRRGNVLLIR